MSREAIIAQLAEALLQRHWLVACAESCTGGGIATALTDVAGSSAWFDRAFVTYSNAAKREMLAVSAETLDRCGAVSRATVTEMAQGALAQSHAQLTVAVSGIAGPGGGSPEKPLGTVWLAWATAERVDAEEAHFVGDRRAVRAATIDAALHGLLQRAS